MAVRTRRGSVIARRPVVSSTGLATVLASASAVAQVVTVPNGSRPRPEHGDSPHECAELTRPREVTNDAAVWMGFSEGVDEGVRIFVYGPLSVLAPQPGFIVRGARSDLALSWSASYAIGPISACRRTYSGGTFFFAHRVLVEGTWVASGDRAFTARAGYRYVHHQSTSRLGLGTGLAMALDLAGPHGVRPGVSPELLLHLGRCCSALYWMVSLRWDRYFAAADRNQWMASLGFVYW